jgi:hypothetical protein
MSADVTVADSPPDSISQIKFSPRTNHFIASTWLV